MKAAWYCENGPAEDVLKVGDLPDPSPDDGEVRVRLRTSGINPADTKWREGLRFAIQFDLVIPHFDGGGIIDAVGPGVNKRRIGQRVWVYEAQWQNAYGTAAQYVTLPAHRAVPLPDSAGFDVAACLGVPAVTAHYGVTHGAGDLNGKTVLVSGAAGAVGFYALQFAALLGARAIALVRSETQARIVERVRCDHIIRSDKPGHVRALKAASSTGGVDHFVEVDLAAHMNLICEVANDHACINAFASMSYFHPAVPFYQVFGKNLHFHPYLAFTLPETAKARMAADVTKWLAEDKLTHNIGRAYTLDHIVLAHQHVENSSTPGKVYLEID
jgi:NADPH2:quinone reductase